MKTADEVVALYVQRRKDYWPLHQQMERIKDIYAGNVEVPLPDRDTIEQTYTPNLLATGIDQMAGRIASVMPDPHFAPAKDNRTETRKATMRKKVVGGWWTRDRLGMKMKSRARHLIGYAMSTTVVRWDHRLNMPTWHVRDPMHAYPSSDLIPGVTTPANVIFAFNRTYAWLTGQGYSVGHLVPTGADPLNTQITCLEYIDDAETVLVAFTDPSEQQGWHEGIGRSIELERFANPIGCVPATVAHRVSLEPSGQFDGMVGMYHMQNQLMALEVLAVKKGIWPDTYLVGRPGEEPRFESGPHDGITGKVNIVKGGDIRTETFTPGYQTTNIIDRLERAQRLNGGIPAEFGGESPTNVRTGRRGDSIISATIDFPVAEAQDVLAMALHDENKTAIKLARHYDKGPVSIYVGTGNNTSAITYEASKIFDDENLEHVVAYPISGNDLNTQMIGMGQRVGMGIMSKRSAAELDPYIANPEAEHDAIIAEGIEQALMSGLQQQAAAGALPPLVLAKVMHLVKTDRMELAEALNKVMEDAKAEAEAAAAEQEQPAPEDMAAQAALGGVPPEGQSPIPGANPGQEDLAGLLMTLRQPAMTIQPNRGAAQGAI